MADLEITIRPALLKDADAIRRIYRATTHEATRHGEHWEKHLQKDAGTAGIPASTSRIFIAEVEETPIGFGGIDFEAVEQIRWVYVLPEYQRSRLRVGLRILKTLEEVARQRGLASIRLHSTPGSVAFYEKAGYSAVQPEHAVGHDHPGVEMTKQLGV